MSSLTFEQRDAGFFVKMGWLLTIVGAGGFFLWASLAPLDQGIPVQGTVVVSGKRKAVQTFSPGEVRFTPIRQWTSPLTHISYPVEWQVSTPSGHYSVKAVIDSQELDSRSSTGSIYWEGLSELSNAQGQRVGTGYLEMTGYGQPLRL